MRIWTWKTENDCNDVMKRNGKIMKKSKRVVYFLYVCATMTAGIWNSVELSAFRSFSNVFQIKLSVYNYQHNLCGCFINWRTNTYLNERKWEKFFWVTQHVTMVAILLWIHLDLHHGKIRKREKTARKSTHEK